MSKTKIIIVQEEEEYSGQKEIEQVNHITDSIPMNTEDHYTPASLLPVLSYDETDDYSIGAPKVLY